MGRSERRLTAIMFSDIVGYTALMAADEARGIVARDRHRSVLGQRANDYGGEIIDENGDELVLSFASAVDAVNCALAIQHAGLGDGLELRIGIHVGDVVFEDGRVYGDGVNLASRVRPFAEPGGICVSEEVEHALRNHPNVRVTTLGAPALKNVDRPVELYALSGEAEPPSPRAEKSDTRAVAKVPYRNLFFALAILVTFSAVAIWSYGFPPREDFDAAPVLNSDTLDAPAIAILPFANMSADPQQEYFVDGVTQDIIASLGRFTTLAVMSWNAVRSYKRADAQPQEVSRALNVRYLVDGSIRRLDERLRVTVQLTNAANGLLLWSERFDRPIDDVFTVQDEIVLGVVGALAVEVDSHEHQRTFEKPTESHTAYDYVLKGQRNLQELTRSANYAARNMFEKAIALDPQYAAAHAGLGWTYNYDAAYGWTVRPDHALQTAHEFARQAIQLDPNSASAYTLLSQIHVYKRRYELAVAAIDQAIRINPSAAESHAHRGWVMLASGQPDESIKSSETALRFDPSSPPLILGNLGWAYYFDERYEDAVALLERAQTKNADYAFAVVGLVVSYAEMGRVAGTERALTALRRVSTFFDIAAFSQLFQQSADQERIAAALRGAGLD